MSSSLISFTVRFVLIRTLGVEAVSLNGLFTEVIAMLSLAEMGVGTAIVYNLYVPLMEQDEKRLAALMNLFKTAYRLIALAIFSIGLFILPFVHLLVNGMEIDLGYLRLIYLLFLIQAASSYLFSYKASLLNADQKNYVVSRYSMLLRIGFGGVSIVFLLLTRNYIVYLLLQIAATLSINLAVSGFADRQYPFLKRKERLNAGERKKIFVNIRHLFIEVLSGKITNSTDNILISTLVGTLHIGSYSCYTMIIHALQSLLLQIHHATTGSIGNLVVEGDNSHTEIILRRLTFITYCPAILAAVGIYTVSTPFIRLLYGERYLLPMPVVFVCVVNFLIYLIKNPLWSIARVSGLFAENKNISLLGDSFNLLVSVILGKRLGILGILLGTNCTLLVQHGLKTRLLFRKFLHIADLAYIRLFMKELLTGLLCLLAAQAVCMALPVVNVYLQILCYGVCSELIAIGINYLLFHATPEFRYMVELGRKAIKRR